MQTLKTRVVVNPNDGFDRWHQVTCRDFSVTECTRSALRDFHASISIREFGPLRINDIWSSAAQGNRIVVTRSPGDIRKDPRDYFMLWLGIAGDTVFKQRSREVRVRSGDIFLLDQGQPFTLEFGQRSHAMMISIPRALLISRLPVASSLTARPIAGESKLGALAGSIVRHLSLLEDTTEESAVNRLCSSAIDIFATAVETELGERCELDWAQERLDRVKKYILANLANSELNREAIARANNISSRTLYRLFATEGTTPIWWLWQQRLLATHRALTEGRVKHVKDAALSTGFTDMSHFSRVFKAAFGEAPHVVAKSRNVDPLEK